MKSAFRVGSGTGTVALLVTPEPKPRMSQRDKWLSPPRPCVAAYRLYCDRLRGLAEREGFRLPDAGLSLVFYLPMPPSWPKKKRATMDGAPHQQKPDLDNLLKAFSDALRPDDSGIWRLDSLEKRWSETGRIHVSVRAATATAEAA